ncbi:MAG: hypothetical protein OXR84_07530 [Magnetovibrio sp.]|nr:hypothetical protein [Magnetovibrio sp.]
MDIAHCPDCGKETYAGIKCPKCGAQVPGVALNHEMQKNQVTEEDVERRTLKIAGLLWIGILGGIAKIGYDLYRGENFLPTLGLLSCYFSVVTLFALSSGHAFRISRNKKRSDATWFR